MPVWDRSYMGDWRLCSVDPKTWGDRMEIPGSGKYSITANCSDTVPLLQAATFEVDLGEDDVFEPGWYRVEMRADDGYERNDRVYIATLICEKASGNFDYGRHRTKVKGRSVLAPVNDAKMLAGEFITEGADGAEWVYEMIKSHTPAPVSVEGSFTIDSYYVWDANTSYLKAVWQVLDAAGWCILLNGLGEITVCEKPKEPVLTYDNLGKSLFLPGMDYDDDYSEIPNRYYAVEGANRVVAVNDDPDSPTSYTRRGWWKDEVDYDVIRVNGETLQDYAERKLEEKSTVVKTHSYTREYVEGVVPFTIVRANDGDKVQGDLRVISQQFQTEHGLSVSEEAGMEVKLWQRILQ